MKTVIVPVFTSCRRKNYCEPVILESLHFIYQTQQQRAVLKRIQRIISCRNLDCIQLHGDGINLWHAVMTLRLNEPSDSNTTYFSLKKCRALCDPWDKCVTLTGMDSKLHSVLSSISAKTIKAVAFSKAIYKTLYGPTRKRTVIMHTELEIREDVCIKISLDIQRPEFFLVLPQA
jgi:hypothetical protein